ncbi:MAG TPA: restriction endonuclease [Solirubrobacterales bacterium]
MHHLGALSDIEFESLASDLLHAVTGRRYERFGVGPDGGVDLRYINKAKGMHEVVQCKHYFRSSFSQLEAAAKKEVPKLEKLTPAPTSYRFVTSQTLTKGQKGKLVEALGGWITDPGMIWGGESIEDHLNDHEEVERNHVKLWLSSSTQLEKLLNAGTLNRSNDLIERITQALPRYVQTQRFNDAEEMLEKVGVCLIAGEPGIGKTTLAQMLLLDCAQKGFEALYVSEDVSEAWDALAETSQAFYYDDFLGRIGLQGLSKNEDQRLVELIAKAHRDPRRTRLILTTREYILRGAVQLYESFERVGLDHERFLLALEDYSRYERGLVLYNHLYHSETMRPEWLVQLLESKAYVEIIDHPNYNPRLIEFITGHAKAHELDHVGNDWVGFALAALNNPEEIWKRAFEQELDELQRAMLICLISIGAEVEVDDLRSVVRSHCKRASIAYDDGAFDRALKVLDLTFVEFGHRGEKPALDVANPSISDFVLNLLAENQNLLAALLDGATLFTQPRQLLEVAQSQAESKLSQKMKTALDTDPERLAEALMRTIDSEEVTRRGIALRGGRILFKEGAGPEERLRVILDTRESLFDEGDRRRWLEAQLEELRGEWEAGSIDASNAVSLQSTLVGSASLGELAKITGAELKNQLERKLGDADDFELLDDLWQLDSELFEPDERASMINEFRDYAENALYEDTGTEELDSIERVADSFGLLLNPEDIEEARSRANREEWEPDIDDYREGRGEPDEIVDDDEVIEELFDRLGSVVEPETGQD